MYGRSQVVAEEPAEVEHRGACRGCNVLQSNPEVMVCGKPRAGEPQTLPSLNDGFSLPRLPGVRGSVLAELPHKEVAVQGQQTFLDLERPDLRSGMRVEQDPVLHVDTLVDRKVRVPKARKLLIRGRGVQIGDHLPQRVREDHEPSAMIPAAIGVGDPILFAGLMKDGARRIDQHIFAILDVLHVDATARDGHIADWNRTQIREGWVLTTTAIPTDTNRFGYEAVP